MEPPPNGYYENVCGSSVQILALLLFPAIIRSKKTKVLATIIHPYAATLNRYRGRRRGGGARSSNPLTLRSARSNVVYACNVTSNPAKQFSRVSPKFLFVYRRTGDASLP